LRGSVSIWLELCKTGDSQSSRSLWGRYHKRVIGLAKNFLRHSGFRNGVEEDVAQEVFNSFFLHLNRGKYPELSSRDNLWRLLASITKNKSIDYVRRSNRIPDGRKLQYMDMSDEESTSEISRKFNGSSSDELREEIARVLEQLHDATLNRIVDLRLQGYNNTQVATQIGCSRRTVIRKLDRMRQIWLQSQSDPDD
jgi:RNA polymerase sigma factor (sigma-70 family)